ncbi:zinc transport system permease protein [Caloranaerobacter azorensis DSM 13643]|uniref:Zinc transport system permease protein n=1 Tax=Caloranaerobacter azorensis DSM 13643 TaxID=1121264 RepID=A0A1M5RGB7_9FIRM|nr:metal ABC transporter permease [Caloranaerobacter azorensis]SHH25345.1 zinc transport system permease protein [Caloranaerobacter azorensis DSM 13643]
MFDLLQYGFMQRALIAGIIIGILCPLIGIFVVLRRMSLIGDSLAHVALSGVAAGLLAGVYPLSTALLFSVSAALAIEKLRKSYEDFAELAIAIILSLGISIAVVLISFAKSLNVDLMSYLFGSIITVSKTDVYMVIGLGLVIVIFVKLFYKELLFITFDEEAAKIAGIPIKTINFLFIVLVAMTITVSMRIVGILLVSSMMVMPVATSLQIARSFKQAIFLSVIFAEISVVLGIFISYYLEIASGGTIVLFSVLMLILTIVLKNLILKIKLKKNLNRT